MRRRPNRVARSNRTTDCRADMSTFQLKTITLRMDAPDRNQLIKHQRRRHHVRGHAPAQERFRNLKRARGN
jgi:hypothetical protein